MSVFLQWLKQTPRRTILVGLAALLLIYLAIPLSSPLFSPNHSTLILGDKDPRSPEKIPILRVFLNRDEQWCLPPRPDLPPPEKLQRAVLTYEDRYFFWHPGVSPVAILRALYQNLNAGHTVSGASTLTMQVARLMRPKKRSYLNKLLEILQALKIETLYSKQEILRLYLDHAPYGGNVVGYQAASLRYFQKMPYQLTWGEAATLAVLPNAPGLISPDTDPARLAKKRNRLLTRLREEQAIDEETFRSALLEAVPNVSHAFPWRAPHLGRYLKERRGDSGGIIRTTIDAAHQQRIAEMVQTHMALLNEQSIQNAAALVAETGSGKIRVYVGSADFFDAQRQGQVDGVQAPRSSGSLLKPFLYALSMDEGIALPQTLMKDVPTFYGAFSPSNANERFSGILPAREALIRSLNVPAVRLLYTHGLYPFHLFLRSAGVSTLFRPAHDYGLPLILGGAEVTLWDMAMLYRGLASGGRFSPLQIAAESDPQPEYFAGRISPGTCYLTLNMLRELRRPGAEFYWEQYQNQWPLAWKTGTSYGQRDAWAVGVNPQWTIAVWVGNFSGEGNANLSGARCAGPLLFDIFNYLPKDPRQAWFSEPLGELIEVTLCRESGFLAGANCPGLLAADAPRYMKPLRLCPYHQRIYVSADSQHQVCSRCWEPGQYQARSALIFPADVMQYLREGGQILGDVPLHNPDCPVQQMAGQPLRIIYPTANARLWVPRDFGGKFQKVTLQVAHRERQRQVYWYLNDHYLGSTSNRHDKAVALDKGWNILEVVDETGHRDRQRFYVDRRTD